MVRVSRGEAGYFVYDHTEYTVRIPHGCPFRGDMHRMTINTGEGVNGS